MDSVGYRSPAYLRSKGRGGSWEPSPPPYLPHGERLPIEEQDVPLPLPVCVACREPIYYEKKAWHHRDSGRLHEAEPEEWTNTTHLTDEERRERKNARNREYRKRAK